MEILALLVAVTLDLAFAEPPKALHPVVWFGKIVSAFERLKFSRRVVEIVYGAVCCLSVILFAFFLVFLPLPSPLDIFWKTYLLFSSFSIMSMIKHANACILNGIDRNAVQMIVSRNTKDLNEYQLCSAVIESVAENYVDGVFAPLFYFSIFGFAGALVYRAVNTCDAMIGYRTGRYEAFGKFAARLDDVLNFLPSRLSLLFFEIFKRGALSYGLRNRVKLNGCTISAMSYVLGVKLEKPGYYSLPGRNPDVEDVRRAIRLFFILSLAAIAMSAAIRLALLTTLQF